MTLINLVVLMIVLGALWLLIITTLPIPDTGRKVVNILMTMLFALFALVILISVLGAVGLGDVRLGLPKGG